MTNGREAASSTVASSSMVAMAIVKTGTMGMEEEEDKEGKVKKKFPFSKQKGVVLKSENKLFLGRKENDLEMLRE